MRIRTSEEYRRALEELTRTDPDTTRRHELEAAIEGFAQEHNNSRVRRGRPPTAQAAGGGRKLSED